MSHLTHQNRFGRDRFQEAMKLVHRVKHEDIDWANFKYLVFDAPAVKGTYQERYEYLGEALLVYYTRSLSHAHSPLHLIHSKTIRTSRGDIVCAGCS